MGIAKMFRKDYQVRITTNFAMITLYMNIQMGYKVDARYCVRITRNYMIVSAR